MRALDLRPELVEPPDVLRSGELVELEFSRAHVQTVVGEIV